MVDRLLNGALDAGLNVIDTAECYINSEELIGQTVAARQSSIQLKQDTGALKSVAASATLADVVKALNALGATPADLISILQSMKAAGALRADLEVI